jgi:ketosteroid isomerase-like protein
LEDDLMKWLLTALTVVGISLASTGARADEADIRATYKDFAAAQNARDLHKIGALLLDSPRFLWVSDGQSVWGREATLARMASFQEAPVWRVEPDLAKAVAVEVDANAGYLHLPLQLVIGASENPDRLHFLVSVLCVRTSQGWRIAALFTTPEKQA